MEKTYTFEKKSARMPIKSFRSGAMQVAIWENEANENQRYHTVSFERRYKDQNGQWKSTNHLRVNDLPKAALILSKAYEYLILSEAEEE